VAAETDTDGDEDGSQPPQTAAFLSPSGQARFAFQTADQAGATARQNQMAFDSGRQARGIYQSLAKAAAQRPQAEHPQPDYKPPPVIQE
jgi:hypothetical protein